VTGEPGQHVLCPRPDNRFRSAPRQHHVQGKKVDSLLAHNHSREVRPVNLCLCARGRFHPPAHAQRRRRIGPLPVPLHRAPATNVAAHNDRRADARFRTVSGADCLRRIHVAVATRNDKRSDARFRVSFDAHSVRRRQASGARSVRHSARLVRRTRDRANLMCIGLDLVGQTVRFGCASPRL
jgi:hypothetical protein